MLFLFQGGIFRFQPLVSRSVGDFQAHKKIKMVSPLLSLHFFAGLQTIPTPIQVGGFPFLLTKNPSQGLFGYKIYHVYIIYLKRGGGLPGKKSPPKTHGTHTMKLTHTTKAAIFF